jgi:cytochrome P450
MSLPQTDGQTGPQSLGRKLLRRVSGMTESSRYIPFNGGPRLCIGQQFALTEMAYTITRIFQRYERVVNRMPGPAEMRADIVLQPAAPVLLQFVEVSKKA